MARPITPFSKVQFSARQVTLNIFPFVQPSEHSKSEELPFSKVTFEMFSSWGSSETVFEVAQEHNITAQEIKIAAVLIFLTIFFIGGVPFVFSEFSIL